LNYKHYSPSLVCRRNRFWKGFKEYNINITVQERCRDGGGQDIKKFNRADFQSEWDSIKQGSGNRRQIIRK